MHGLYFWHFLPVNVVLKVDGYSIIAQKNAVLHWLFTLIGAGFHNVGSRKETSCSIWEWTASRNQATVDRTNSMWGNCDVKDLFVIVELQACLKEVGYERSKLFRLCGFIQLANTSTLAKQWTAPSYSLHHEQNRI